MLNDVQDSFMGLGMVIPFATFQTCSIHKMNLPYKRFNPCTWSLSYDGGIKLGYIGDFQFLSNQPTSMSIFMLQALWVFEGYTCLHQWSNPSRWQSTCPMYFEVPNLLQVAKDMLKYLLKDDTVTSWSMLLSPWEM
jgi:hypothetical protein